MKFPISQLLWEYVSPTWAGKFPDRWCTKVMRSRIELMKKMARTIRSDRELILNWFEAEGTISAGIVEGLNNKLKVTFRRAYGFNYFKTTEIALYHSLGKLPEPEFTHRNLRRSLFHWGVMALRRTALARDKINGDPTLPGVWNDGRHHEDARETGDDWFIWQPTIAPAKPHRPGRRSQKEVVPNLNTGPSTLAAQLCWKVGKPDG